MDYVMASKAAGLASRLEGRLFADEGRLYLVIDVDTEAGFARVSYRADGQQQVAQIPISEVSLRLSFGSNLLLDGASTADKSNRIIKKTDGWFFTTRDGVNGPYQSETEATEALSKYILSVQSNSPSRAANPANDGDFAGSRQ